MEKDVIQLTRELGEAIQKDDRYIKFEVLNQKADTDTTLQNIIGEFNIARMELSRLMKEPEENAEKIQEQDAKVRELYEQAMNNPAMVEFNKAKDEINELLKSVNYIISCAANGEDPMTCPEKAPEGCTGSCSTCGGCG